MPTVIVQPGAVNIFYHSGLILKKDLNTFRRILFRVSRGKVLCKMSDEPVLSYELSGTRFVEIEDGTERVCYVLVF